MRVATEFDVSNVKSILHIQTFGHIASSKVFALLDLPSDSREEFGCSNQSSMTNLSSTKIIAQVFEQKVERTKGGKLFQNR